MIEVPQLKEQLTNLNKTINENEKKLREVERGIYDADVDLKKQVITEHPHILKFAFS